MATPRTQLATGSLFAGAYRIVRPLGSDSDGDALYLATQGATARQCALRVLPAKLVETADGRARFDELCSLRAGIESEHVVDLLDAGVDKATGAPWFAMPFLKGENLEEHADEALAVDDALEILGQLTHGLGAMTDAGCVHGALRPTRIMVVEGEHYAAPVTVRILDFWSGTLLRERAGGAAPDGNALRWSAPETFDASAALSRTADVWSFGLLAFRLLTGDDYWKSADDDAALREEVTSASIESASRRARSRGHADLLPDGFDAWFAQCVTRTVDARFPDIDEACDALEALLGVGEAEDAGAEEPARPAARPSMPLRERLEALPPWMRNMDFAVPAALALVTVVALGARQIVRSRNAHAPPPAAATAPSAPSPALPGFTPGEIDERVTADLVRRLGAVPRGTPAWIAVTPDDPAATTRAEQLRSAFSQAGWDVRPIQRFTGRLRPGFFLFAAAMEPPDYVTTLGTALRANHLIQDFSRGYRDYYRERTAVDPTFVGFPMEPEQTFVLVVGRTP